MADTAGDRVRDDPMNEGDDMRRIILVLVAALFTFGAGTLTACGSDDGNGDSGESAPSESGGNGSGGPRSDAPDDIPLDDLLAEDLEAKECHGYDVTDEDGTTRTAVVVIYEGDVTTRVASHLEANGFVKTSEDNFPVTEMDDAGEITETDEMSLRQTFTDGNIRVSVMSESGSTSVDFIVVPETCDEVRATLPADVPLPDPEPLSCSSFASNWDFEYVADPGEAYDAALNAAGFVGSEYDEGPYSQFNRGGVWVQIDAPQPDQGFLMYRVNISTE